MSLHCLHNKAQIARFLNRDPYLYLYLLGDLEADQWPHTTWYGWVERGRLQALALVYTRFRRPVLQALENRQPAALEALLGSLLPYLPGEFWAHLSPGMDKVLARACRVAGQPHLKMALRDPGRLADVAGEGVVRLGPGNAEDLQQLYAEASPHSFFDPLMLESLPHFGRWVGGRLVSAAGVHVFSPRCDVAAVANVATHPSARRRGHARAVLAALCRHLHGQVTRIGLNVRADNEAAQACYRALGFTPVAAYGEYDVERR